MQTLDVLIREVHEEIATHLVAGRLNEIQSVESRAKQIVLQHPDAGTEALRELDLLALKLLFSWLIDGHSRLSEAQIIRRCDQYFGERQDWLRQFQVYRQMSSAIVLVVLTWQCEIRCTYCTIPKQDGREISKKVLDDARELLLSAPQNKLQFRYFGGEPLLEWEKIQYSVTSTMEWLTQSDRCRQKEISFLITTNGIQLNEDKIKWLAQYPVHLQIALDGLPEAQNQHRVFPNSTQQSYDNCAIDKAALLQAHKVPHTVVLVVHPSRIDHFVDDFRHVVEKGFEIIQINWAHNTRWQDKHLKAFANGLHELGRYLHERWGNRLGPKVLNLRETLLKVRVSQELTVDYDGKIYANHAFLFRPKVSEDMHLGHVQDGRNWLHYKVNGLSSEGIEEESIAKKIFVNNSKVGSIFNSWIRWMNKQGIPDFDSVISTRYK